MNQPDQLAKLKEINRTVGLAGNPHTPLSARLLHAALQSPVFLWSPAEQGRTLTESEQQFVNEFITPGAHGLPVVAPFPAFRISRPECFDQWFFFANPSWRLVRCLPADGRGPEQWQINDYGMRIGGNSGEPTLHNRYRIFINGRDRSDLLPRTPDGRPTAAVTQQMGTAPLLTLSYFLFELFLPGSITLRVSPPPKPGKSIEWQLARTHYVVLTRRQAEHCRATRAAPTAQQLQRAAHWRRAHLRRLRSARFTHKQGQLVRVAQAWVGPEEWVGLDRKIYRVVNLNVAKP